MISKLSGFFHKLVASRDRHIFFLAVKSNSEIHCNSIGFKQKALAEFFLYLLYFYHVIVLGFFSCLFASCSVMSSVPLFR